MAEDAAIYLSDENPDHYALRRAWARLALAVRHGRPLSDVYGLGDEAAVHLYRLLGELATVDGASLRHPQDRYTSDLRRIVRLIGACLFDRIPVENEQELALEVLGMLGGDETNLTYYDIWHVLFVPCKHGGNDEARNSETTVAEYRLVCRMLKAGETQRDIVAKTGIAQRIVGHVETFGGYQAFRRDMLSDAAWRAYESGLSTRDFAVAHGMPERTARRMLASIGPQVEAALAEEEEE